MVKDGQQIYIFDCPEHGDEQSVFCFRAFAEENKHRWGKYEITLYRKDFEDDGELDSFLDRFRASAQIRGLGVIE